MSASATPRVAPLDPPYEAAVASAFARITPPGREPLKLFRTMAHSPRVLQRMFAGSLLDKGPVSLRDRELVILRTCARCGSEYEWGVHVAYFAGRAGLGEEETKGTLAPSHPWTKHDALLIGLVDALHDHAALPDELWRELADTFSPEQLLELITLTGYYHTISFLTNTLRVEREDYAPGFSAT